MDDFENESFFRKNAIWLVVLAGLVIFGFLLFKGWDKIVNEEIDGMVTITGSFSCLPLKTGVEVSGECTLGVKSRDGFYFALDISRIQDANTDLKAEDTIAVTGTLESKDKISISEWSDYDIMGIVLVNTLLRTR
ncbi:MAG: hypothetical protein A3C70_00240 [Candidatus Zambryskibacteria bacterium RIFCSPHIGHO2_02_FULL_43_14]|uniref:Uncharacterized protein n=1 Tax=Candidatus Zambryskibacteria bacterium RIFCSPHIGHO2_02_FULL_43_14 TaxID=1802748 RepID=A0A1G2TF11_9BACT|nr:MAG: hypothetical protein A2829_03290 [Candidatus Zambryskibacteria bacterium RIFCSPHIGHO2_01_FULL_43_60]OHA95877.1 MAG: hypothetical protein A3C70_00240 [Candidatus Zambryskibacteria bacterium RIFCSPHIGHO2_02_FULL_43_14]OHB03414.1 MAG: hypothetical protein A3B03_02425 [Candidatus Zambryskibacteria bacterium RIFCSPLOWO2_01_FULL_42_41]